MLNEQIQQAIKDNLPETVANEMKEFILRAEKTSTDLENLEKHHGVLKADHDTKVDVIAEKNNEINILKDQIKLCEDCAERNIQLQIDEIAVALRKEHSSERVGDMKELVSMVFKSPVYRKSVTTEKNIPVASGTTNQNGCVEGGEYVEKHTDTETAETSED